MGCISSKSSVQQQPNDPVVIIPNHATPDHLFTNLKSTDDTLERCSSFHTVEEYDELVQRMINEPVNVAELAGVRVPETVLTDSSSDEKKQDMEFQTVASLRQWLHAPGPGGVDAAIAADYSAPKVGFSFYENDSDNTQGAEEKSVLVKTKHGKQEEEENIVELVAAFDKYMQQLQIDEENILKQIHNMIN